MTSQPPRQQQAGVPVTRAPLDSVSRRLDDMLFMLFSPHIISYEPPKGFIVPKFTMYDGMSDSFDHIIHFRQLMTLDIGNDALMCKPKHSIFRVSRKKKLPITMDDLFSISYEKLLPQIHDLLDFRWVETIKTNPEIWDRNRRCSYYKDHGHTTEQCKSLHYLVEKRIRAKRGDTKGSRPRPYIFGSPQGCH
ncbi:hypothetical protein AAG906_018042 [Vitis piasezkii]